MITYGFSIQGKGHIQRGIVCQDSSIVDHIKSGHYVGIVADGVGSARHADIGSDIAVKSLFQYCCEHIQKNSSSNLIEDVLADGYAFAFKQVEKEAVKQGAAIEDFDTTLSAVVYSRKTVVYGHSGDGGIIAKYADGTIGPLTSRQKGADGTSVIPLRGGRGSWVFGTEENVVSVLLVTDGMLDGVIQPLLINQPPNRMAQARGDFRRDRVYVTAAEFFMNPHSVYQNKSVKDPDKYMRYFLEGNLDGSDQDAFLQCILAAYVKQLGKKNTVRIKERIEKYFYTVWAVSKVTDDKSAVCIMDEKVGVEPQDLGYYEEPEWEMLQEKYQSFLYGDAPVSEIREIGPSELNKKKVIRDEGDDEKQKLSQIREKLPAVLISLVVGCVLGSAITLFLTLSFGKTSGRFDITTTGQPAAEQKSTKPPRTKEPNTGTPKSETPKSETKVQKEVSKLLMCLLQLNVSELSQPDKEKLHGVLTTDGFSEYMEILKDEKNIGSNIHDGSAEADIKAVDSSVDSLVQIAKQIKKEMSQKGKAEQYRSELKKMFDNFDPKDKNNISFTVREICLDNIKNGKTNKTTEK